MPVAVIAVALSPVTGVGFGFPHRVYASHCNEDVVNVHDGFSMHEGSKGVVVIWFTLL
jgi:hypothetical protein